MTANVARESRLMTDEAPYYPAIGTQFTGHKSVNHSADEWARGDAHTNTLEGFFSIFKRGMRGVYQHCGERHLHRYLAEFDFRYNNRAGLGVSDETRAMTALVGVRGKRLLYRDSSTWTRVPAVADVLLWARESFAGLSLEEAAKKLRVKPETLYRVEHAETAQALPCSRDVRPIWPA